MTDRLDPSAALPAHGGNLVAQVCARCRGVGLWQPRQRREPRRQRPGSGVAQLNAGTPRHAFIDLVEAFRASNIPILVQVCDWARIPESFRNETARSYVVLQEGPLAS